MIYSRLPSHEILLVQDFWTSDSSTWFSKSFFFLPDFGWFCWFIFLGILGQNLRCLFLMSQVSFALRCCWSLTLGRPDLKHFLIPFIWWNIMQIVDLWSTRKHLTKLVCDGIDLWDVWIPWKISLGGKWDLVLCQLLHASSTSTSYFSGVESSMAGNSHHRPGNSTFDQLFWLQHFPRLVRSSSWLAVLPWSSWFICSHCNEESGEMSELQGRNRLECYKIMINIWSQWEAFSLFYCRIMHCNMFYLFGSVGPSWWDRTDSCRPSSLEAPSLRVGW